MSCLFQSVEWKLHYTKKPHTETKVLFYFACHKENKSTLRKNKFTMNVLWRIVKHLRALAIQNTMKYSHAD